MNVPTVIAAHPNDFFATEASFPGVSISAIHGSSATNIFAVGTLAGSAWAARYDGSFWSVLSIPNIGTPQDVFSLDSTLSYITISSANPQDLLIWNSGTFTSLSIGPASDTGCTGVWAVSSTNVNLNCNSRVNRYNGATWGTPPTGPTGCVTGSNGPIWGLTGSIIARGRNAAGTPQGCADRYETVSAGTWDSSQLFQFQIRDVWGFTNYNGFFLIEAPTVGSNGDIYRFNGVAFVPQMAPTPPFGLFDLHGSSLTDIWAVGAGGTALHSIDGSTWQQVPSTTSATYTGVYAASTTQAWAVTDTGLIQKLQVVPVTSLPSISGLNLDQNNLRVTTSQAQCLGDETELDVQTDQVIGSGGLHGYVIQESTQLVVSHYSSLVAGGFLSINQQLFYRDDALPAGSYEWLVTEDVTGALSQDLFAAQSFNVPAGDCGLQSHQEHLGQGIAFEHCHESDNCPTSGGGGSDLQLMDMNVQESWTFLFLFGLMVWAMRRGWPWIVGGCVLLLPMTILANFPLNFETAVLLLTILFAIQYLANAGKPIRDGYGQRDSV